MLFLLIHGAYTSPWHWHRLVPHLREAGAEVVVPELPCDDVSAGLERYAEIAEGALEGTEEPPIVVGSSFGATTACVVASRRPVEALITVCGVIPAAGRPVGADAAEMTQPAFAESIDVNPDGSTTFRPDAARRIIFHESEPDVAAEAAARLRPQAALPFTEPVPLGPLPDVRRVGITSSEDRLLRPEWLANAVRERLGVEPTVLDGDHGPMLSQPRALAEILLA